MKQKLIEFIQSTQEGHPLDELILTIFDGVLVAVSSEMAVLAETHKQAGLAEILPAIKYHLSKTLEQLEASSNE